MPTPNNAPYKVAQKKSSLAGRGEVIWVSCVVSEDGPPGYLIKKSVQGTYRRETNPLRPQPKGKAQIKAAKRLTHIKGFYAKARQFAAMQRLAN